MKQPLPPERIACESDGRSKPTATHLIGVGPDQEFSTARKLTDMPVLWFGSIASLAEAPDLPQQPDPFILLVDGDMPFPDLIGMLDQYAALVAIRPIILQLSYPSIRTVVASMQRGVLDVLPKPYTLARLSAALEDVLPRPESPLL